jgi:signal transduction histidine kinase
MAAPSPPSRTRSARLTLISLLLIPLLSLAALWGFTASITLGNVVRNQHYNTLVNTITSSVTSLDQDLAVERALTLVFLGTGRRSPRAPLLAARGNTDTAAAGVRSSLTSVRGLLGPAAVGELNTFLADVAGLPRIRAAVDSGADSKVTAFNSYAAISTAEWALFHIASPPSDPTLSLMTQAAIAATRAEDLSGGAISLIDGALAARGQMTQAERTLFAQVVGQQNAQIGDALVLAAPAQKADYERAFGSPAFQQLTAVENQVESSPDNRPLPVNPRAFQATATTLQQEMRTPLEQSAAVLAAQSARLRDSLQTELVLVGGFGLVAVLASVFVAVRFGRRLRVELTGLYDSARQVANERLPRLVERLRRGEDVDVHAESPLPQGGQITEIAHVAEAFSSVHRTAVEAAVGQAILRKGVNQVFVNLSLRNQSLLHRQLSMLDEMERAAGDPDALADLFRLDHLTTRMRRHAEGLLILAGSTPGRGWRDPVPVVDVLNAATAEIEDYLRVDVVSESGDAVAGTAVNDVIHLIAELIENATAFSPPNTRVEIRGDTVGHGFAVEIEDRGLGLIPEEMASINERLASPPEFDLADSEELGLFVVGQLAARHGVRVSLRQSPFGGTTAIVVLPREIMVREHEAVSLPGSGSAGELASAAANGSAPQAAPPPNRERAAAFGLTGRHRSASPPEAGRAGLPAGGAAALPSPSSAQVPGQPGRGEPGPARAQAGSAMVEAWTSPGQTANGPAAGGTHRGLPRRVRQASLAPQLRGQPGSQPVAPASEAAEPSARSPEQMRSMLSALQDGWQRGRHGDLAGPDAELDDWPGRTPGEWPGGALFEWWRGGAGGAEASAADTEPDDREVEP